MYNLAKSYGFFLILVCTILVSSISVQSQEYNNYKGKANSGFEAGIQFSSVDDPLMAISKSGVGYNAGPFIEYYLTDIIKLRGGIEFDHRSFQLEDMNYLTDDSSQTHFGSYYNQSESFKVNYVTVPISIIYIKGNEKFSFYLQGTLYYSIFLNSTQSGNIDVFVSEQDASNIFFKDYPELSTPGHHVLPTRKRLFNTSDLGIIMRIGIVYNLNEKIGISLSPGLTYSFSDVWENPLLQTSWTRLYKITAGFVYNLK